MGDKGWSGRTAAAVRRVGFALGGLAVPPAMQHGLIDRDTLWTLFWAGAAGTVWLNAWAIAWVIDGFEPPSRRHIDRGDRADAPHEAEGPTRGRPFQSPHDAD